jgi:hypothetical protein
MVLMPFLMFAAMLALFGVCFAFLSFAERTVAVRKEER